MQELKITEGQEFNALSARLPDWTGWLSTFVMDSSGNFVGDTGSSRDISNHTDLQLLLALRAKAHVIVTTGKTARQEHYKSSRFAPIAILTRDPNSVSTLPLFANTAEHNNFTLSPPEGSNLSHWLTSQLQQLGYTKFLFEGGPSTLAELLKAGMPLKLVISVTGNSQFETSQASDLVERLLGDQFDFDLKDQFRVNENLVFILESKEL